MSSDIEPPSPEPPPLRPFAEVGETPSPLVRSTPSGVEWTPIRLRSPSPPQGVPPLSTQDPGSRAGFAWTGRRMDERVS